MDLEQRVIDLHNIAREIEQSIGQGELSKSIRDAADILSALLKTEFSNA